MTLFATHPETNPRTIKEQSKNKKIKERSRDQQCFRLPAIEGVLVGWFPFSIGPCGPSLIFRCSYAFLTDGRTAQGHVKGTTPADGRCRQVCRTGPRRRTWTIRGCIVLAKMLRRSLATSRPGRRSCMGYRLHKFCQLHEPHTVSYGSHSASEQSYIYDHSS